MDDPNKNDSKSNKLKVTFEDVQRVLEVGRLLKSVLTEEELEELAKTINTSKNEVQKYVMGRGNLPAANTYG